MRTRSHSRRRHKTTRRQAKQKRTQRRRTRRRAPRPPTLPRLLLQRIGSIFGIFAGVFTRPTAERIGVLMLAAILTTGNRTILNLLRTVDGRNTGHPSSYHRVFSHRRWSTAALARAWIGYLLPRWCPNGVVPIVGDDTVFEHRGKNVYGKGRHRDAVRSSHSYTAFTYGHKWVVLAILVRVPWSNRPWALPVLSTLYRTPEWNEEHGFVHKTPAELMRQLLAVLLRWFPDRRFQFVGDGGFGTHDLAAFAYRHRRRLTLVSRFYPDAMIYERPPISPQTRKKGRPRLKGNKLPAPQDVVAGTRRKRHRTVAWYGGGRRDVAIVSGTGHWYRAGRVLVGVRWVYVKDRTGTHRDEYFFSSDPDQSPEGIVETYTSRWSIETTFQEVRSSLRIQKMRGWSEPTVLRATPCLMSLYGVVVAIYAELPKPWQAPRSDDAGNVAFAEVLSCVRRWLWSEWIFANPRHEAAFRQIPKRLRDTLLRNLAPGP